MSEFRFSDDVIRRRSRVALTAGPFAGLGSAAFVLAISPDDLTLAMIAWGVAWILVIVTGAITIPLVNFYLRRLRVIIDDKNIIKDHGRGQQSFLLHSISRITVHEGPQGQVTGIQIEQSRGRFMHILGMTNMEGMVSLLREKVAAGTPVLVKRHRIDWSGSAATVTGVIIMIMLLLFTAYRGEESFYILVGLYSISMGTFLLVRRPMTRTSGRFAPIEVALGILLTGFGAYEFILQLAKFR